MSGRPALLRRGDEPPKASFLELFFDLAFVFALRQLSVAFLADASPAGAARTALLLLALWWVWVVTAWYADWYARANRWVQALLVATTLGVTLMSVAVPHVYAHKAVLFAGAYVAINVGRGSINLFLLRGHRLRRRTLRVFVWISATGVLWLIGAFWPAGRVPVWAVALALDYVGPHIGWPTPWLGRTRPEDLKLRGEHVTERYQQIFIIALGELVLGAGLAYTATAMNAAHSAAFLLVFAVSVLIGQLYVTPAGRNLGTAINERDPSRFGAVTGDLHLLMIAGVLAASVGAEFLITHPTDQGPAVAVGLVTVGPALFLAGRVALSAAIYRRVSWARLAGLLGVLVAGVTAYALPLVGVGAVATAVLLGVAVLDRRLGGIEPTRPVNQAGR
ncbi:MULTISPECIES: low temperature requirement protein A [unclassified Micromonospora]|uniref:low temperature requirement protein A n=1 Tax=unclassified Micromonospora TaxID=2617518 RepID=UPI002FF1ACEC